VWCGGGVRCCSSQRSAAQCSAAQCSTVVIRQWEDAKRRHASALLLPPTHTHSSCLSQCLRPAPLPLQLQLTRRAPCL
jgi:hypothetical protein